MKVSELRSWLEGFDDNADVIVEYDCMKELERLLKENSGLLSRMKERDGNEKLNKICEEIFKKDLTNFQKQSIIQIQREEFFRTLHVRKTI